MNSEQIKSKTFLNFEVLKIRNEIGLKLIGSAYFYLDT